MLHCALKALNRIFAISFCSKNEIPLTPNYACTPTQTHYIRLSHAAPVAFI